MDLFNLNGDEWRTLVVIPAAVSLAVNIFTAPVQRGITALLANSASHLNGGLDGLLKLRIRQIDQELSELNKLHLDQNALLKHYQATVTFIGWGIWILLLSPIVGGIVQLLASHYAAYLPGEWGKFYAMPGMAFGMVVTAMFAAGPFQAAIYSSIIRRKLNKLINNPEALFGKLEKDREKLAALLPRVANEKPLK